MLSRRSISTLRKFDLHDSDFTAQWVAPWGRFCIFREGERGRGKNERQRGGGCAKPLRGQAPVTPNFLILRSFHLATRYKSEIFVERDPREMANLPESQIFMTRFQWDPTAVCRPSKSVPVLSFPAPSRRPCILPDTNPSFYAECEPFTVFSPPKIPADICRDN